MKNLFVLLVLLGLTSCVGEQRAKAIKEASNVRFTENSEMNNIVKRLKLTGQPALVGFVLLINQAGQPIYYTTVSGKITSSGKKLDAYVDDGVDGKSDEYIYFWTSTGKYIQWNGKYLYSDKTFRLNIKPIAVDITNKEKK